jgi:hypothetical protein
MLGTFSTTHRVHVVFFSRISRSPRLPGLKASLFLRSSRHRDHRNRGIVIAETAAS